MTTFMDYYMVKVQTSLCRTATEEEISLAKEKYIIGWHPERTANLILENEWSLKVNKIYQSWIKKPEVRDVINGFIENTNKMKVL